ncbi:pseudouridylate synthase, partial [Thraustotheca clavata]
MTQSKRTDATCVGISQYCSPAIPGFNGRIKQEPEDFEVREIDIMGNVVNLTALTLPTNTIEPTVKKGNSSMELEEPDEGWEKYLIHVVGMTAYAEIEQVVAESLSSYTLLSPIDLVEKVALLKAIQDCFPALQCDTVKPNAAENEPTPPTIIQLSLDPLYLKLKNGNMDIDDCKRIMKFLLKGSMHVDAEKGVDLAAKMTKEERTKIHRLVASSTACLVTKTNTGNGITVYFSPKMLKKRKRKHKIHTYVQFTLCKINIDHFSVLEILAQTLKTTVSSFTYAGTKDKRAITYQKVVAQDILPNVFISSSETLAALNISLGDLEFISAPLTLGQSKGNQFTIRVKEVDGSKSTIQAAISSLKANGFINYFGFQRVGHPNIKVRTHHIGQALYQQNWEKAIELFFSPNELDAEVSRTIKLDFMKTRDASAALKSLPPGFVVERAILMV